MANTSQTESGLAPKENELVLENTETNKNTATKRRGRPARTTTTKKTATAKKIVTPAPTLKAEAKKPVEEVKAEETKTVETKIEEVKTKTVETKIEEVKTKKVETEIKEVETEIKEVETEIKEVETKIEEVKTEEVAVEEAKEIIKKVTKGEEMAEEVKQEIDVVQEKKEALKEAKAKFKEAVTLSLDEELARVETVEVISSQFNKSSDFVENMLNKLMQHLEMSEIQGRKKVEDAVDGLLGDNIVNDIVTTTLGYVGGKAAKGYTMGTAPAVAVSGAVKGAYKKIVD